MKELLAMLQHHVDRAARDVAYNALDDCHAPGVTSIVLHDEPGNRVRVFITQHYHELHRNDPGHNYSIAIHPHHCDVRLVGLFGPARNDVYALTPAASGPFHEYDYTSAIANGECALRPTGRRAHVHRIRSEPLSDPRLLLARELHTIHVPIFERAAWLVIEGAEDPDYQPLCWSNETTFDLNALYKPIAPAQVAAYLRDVMRAMQNRERCPMWRTT